MKMLEHATLVRAGGEREVERLCRLRARVVSTGAELHHLMLDACGHDLAPETCEALRWTLVRLGRRTLILIVTQPPGPLP
jgi:hypothetical protein